MTTIQFPNDFMWGASTAAHQIEGNNTASDWWEAEHRAGSSHEEPSGDAADSYHRYGEDIALLAEAGLNTYRFSVEWARVEPEQGFVSKAQLAHYRRMIDTCLEHGVRPHVTLHHFTTPRWAAHRGGWKSAQMPDWFARYTETVLPILDDVEFVCTINEPNMMAVFNGEHERDTTGATLSALPAPSPVATEVLIASHHRSREILATGGGIRSGWAVATQAYHAATPDAEEARTAYETPRETVFLDAARDDDWIAVQGYLRTYIDVHGRALPVEPGKETTLTGWEYFPPAIAIGVRHAWERTGGIPVYVTENGIATSDDRRRIDYTHDALSGIAHAMADGVDVRGYLHWSLLDNYEWGSFKPTFGLIGWDKDTFERTPKPSLAWLGETARTGALVHPDPNHVPYA